MWVYDGECALGDEWADSFIEELDEVTDYHKKDKYFEPYDCFYEALNQWGERVFMYYADQDKFVGEVGLQKCIDLIKENDNASLEHADDGIKFCVFACESAFNQCINWEDDDDDSVEESIRSRRNRARKSMFESRRSTSRRAKARRIR